MDTDSFLRGLASGLEKVAITGTPLGRMLKGGKTRHRAAKMLAKIRAGKGKAKKLNDPIQPKKTSVMKRLTVGTLRGGVEAAPKRLRKKVFERGFSKGWKPKKNKNKQEKNLLRRGALFGLKRQAKAEAERPGATEEIREAMNFIDKAKELKRK